MTGRNGTDLVGRLGPNFALSPKGVCSVTGISFGARVDAQVGLLEIL